ncbi:MAG: FitA-like ribbon-helix-helix domain-containing protein [Coraliomargaritaceae bacterium]
MKSIHIREIDAATLDGLKRRAARHHRSLQKELVVLLKDAAEMAPSQDAMATKAEEKLFLHTVASGRPDANWSRESIYSDDGR